METSAETTVPSHPRQSSGFKRDRNGVQKRAAPPPAATSNSPFMPMFEVFRAELDEHHDRRERIIKASRDITAQSKKIIFSLQRVRTLNVPLPENIAKDTAERFNVIKELFASIEPDLKGVNTWRYQRQVSGGVQELMEALTFQHYIERQALLTPSEAQAQIGDGIVLTDDDYLLGVYDLTGEMMRYAITGMATLGALPSSASEDEEGRQGHDRNILTDLQELRSQFQGLDTTVAGGPLARDSDKKMEVLRACVEKVETAVYGMIVQGQERPKGWIPDLSSEAPPVESY